MIALARVRALMVSRLDRLLSSGDPDKVACSHVWHGGSVILLATAPDLLRCKHCATKVLQSLAGTPEDCLCDVCGRPARQLCNLVGVVGGFTFVASLCSRCETA